MKSDLEIAQSADIKPIREIAASVGVEESVLEPYGHFKAKLPLDLIDESKVEKAKLILVTAISPTPAGEGKTTVTIGLSEGLHFEGKKTVAALREPSLGPVFGLKGGAAGGGMSQVIPMEDINLHFTGDFAAIEKANNLLAAMIDNNIQAKPEVNLGLDGRTIRWKRVMDMNDRALRQIVCGIGGKANGIPREDGFNITAASEIMAILCMSNDRKDLQRRLGDIFVGFTFDKKPIYARDLKAEGAMAALLKDAIKPNLVQTLAGVPAVIHGGPFANIAQGTNSILATKMAMSLGDYVVTEAGFGADLGAEKFFHLKCRASGLKPAAVVVVATIRALRYHGGAPLSELNEPSLSRVQEGFGNLEKHLENMKTFGVQPVVAINQFVTDTDEETEWLKSKCESLGVRCEVSEGWAKGGEGVRNVAKAVIEEAESGKSNLKMLYDVEQTVEEKIEKIATTIYGADGVDFSAKAKADLREIDKLGLSNLPVCIAKTQKSFSDDDSLRNRPSGFRITVREFEFARGAGFIIAVVGNLMRMPGLPAEPAATRITVDANGTIDGLF
ncbi:formate--tetrahydrofolate ligase [Phaeocystidibacter marisrubri]|uniref:Formate--tetrahydrofolate ligase n=1 Tax=Phaeocystidibacter marisrubri TaxID=1577780 RepID=A0A6L3ZHT8_9FLAO|nr:formate--tetrahydrofolate ligase [Phaeocystidibacter marisrubri]KAB2817424.1 formate--tetrahydrofolate ligase [Phaeocystidibacter marisrubri]GGH75418.1 formate--tetrahydrofolate ligase [Phaeocystidibacter marisrubri]